MILLNEKNLYTSIPTLKTLNLLKDKLKYTSWREL